MKNFDLGQIFRKIAILFKFSKYYVFGQIFEKKFNFDQNFPKILKNVDFSKIFDKNRFCPNFRKISILVKSFENFLKCWKLSKRFNFLKNFDLSKISKNIDFGENFEKLRFCSNFRKNFDFRENCRKFRFWLNFFKNFDFGQILTNISIFGQNFRKFRKISISVKFSKTFDFCKISGKFRVCSKFSKNIWKISKNIDLCKILEKFRFGSKFSKNFDFGQIFRKISILVKFFEKFRFCSNFRNITFLVKFSKKNSILIKIFENFQKCRF